jgi:DNA-binding response OmpR family regulator
MVIRNKKKILIIEDEKSLADILKNKLKKRDFNVDVAYNGNKALEKLGVEKYDLIVLDIILPGSNGFEILKKIKRDKIKTLVIVLSNLGQESDKKSIKKFGVKNYFVKNETSLFELVKYIESI